jgi:hypothetical protein
MPGASGLLRRGGLARLIAGDDGLLDYAIAFPVVLLLLLAIFQAALFGAAREAALTAAQQGADTARALGATIAQGDTAACHYAARAARGTILGPTCAGTGGVTVTMTVCGTAPTLVPGLHLRACGQARAPRERFTTP